MGRSRASRIGTIIWSISTPTVRAKRRRRAITTSKRNGRCRCGVVRICHLDATQCASAQHQPRHVVVNVLCPPTRVVLQAPHLLFTMWACRTGARPLQWGDLDEGPFARCYQQRQRSHQDPHRIRPTPLNLGQILTLWLHVRQSRWLNHMQSISRYEQRFSKAALQLWQPALDNIYKFCLRKMFTQCPPWWSASLWIWSRTSFTTGRMTTVYCAPSSSIVISLLRSEHGFLYGNPQLICVFLRAYVTDNAQGAFDINTQIRINRSMRWLLVRSLV